MSSACCFCSSHSDCSQEWSFSPEHDVLVTAQKWHKAVTMAVLHEEIQKKLCARKYNMKMTYNKLNYTVKNINIGSYCYTCCCMLHKLFLLKDYSCVRSTVLTAVLLMYQVFWDVSLDG
jgi:hypothetical protein